MAQERGRRDQKVLREKPRVVVAGDDRVRIEFRIDELLSQLKVPAPITVASCSGCNGCSA